MTEYVGLDVSKEETSFCVKDGEGNILASGKVATDPSAIFAMLKEHCLCPALAYVATIGDAERFRAQGTGRNNPAFGGANRLLGCVATLARCTASRYAPRLPEKPICRHQMILFGRIVL